MVAGVGLTNHLAVLCSPLLLSPLPMTLRLTPNHTAQTLRGTGVNTTAQGQN